MQGAERRAVARENKQLSKAAKRYREQSRHLEAQASALKRALGPNGFGKSLRIRLANVNRVLGQQQAVVNEGYRQRLLGLQGSISDNEKAEGQQSAINTRNMSRERASAVSEAMTHGAGESDVLAAQMMSLRNWEANQAEVSRGYFDTVRSTNSSRIDLNVDTKTALLQNAHQSNADKEQLWSNYFDQRSESFTQLGNVRGQQADYLSQAGEMKKGAGKGSAGKAKQAKGAFMAASKESAKAWKNPGAPASIRNWEGAKEFEATANQSRLEGARTASLSKRPEGATLRKW
jgi:hypothetical protein